MPTETLKRRKRSKGRQGSGDDALLAHQSTNDTIDDSTAPDAAGPEPPINGENKEKRGKKIVTRVTWGAVMVLAFLLIVWAGHLYVFMLVLAVQVMLFKELLSVRYRAAMEKKTPLFRTLQWSWFCLGLFYTHGDSIVQYMEQQTADIPHIDVMEKAVNTISFAVFTACFVLSVLTLRPGLYKYQVGQLGWTIVIMALTVAQLKPVTANIFTGLFWFVFPASCIIINDIMAYFCGITLGRRFIKAPFLSISPNKTWEGFIGAFFFTLLFAWWFAGFLARSPYLTLSAVELRPQNYTLADLLRPGAGFTVSLNRTGQLHSEMDAVFTSAATSVPEIITRHLKLPFKSVPAKPIQLHGLVLAGFGSLVAPFGGLLMSGIKRAYQIKDFNSLIPGHGGVTDRMDCQLVMIFYTFVHYKTFVGTPYRTFASLWPLVERLSRGDKERLLSELQRVLGAGS